MLNKIFKNSKGNLKVGLILTLIIILAVFLRIINLNDNPPALYGDELTMVYDSYSLLKTGHDQVGNLFPLTFSMGAGRPAGYVYSSIPFVAAFGPSSLGVRLLSVLSGLGIILLVFYLGRKLISENVGLIAAMLMAISPWDISLSRGGFEAHFALFLALLGIVSFLGAVKRGWLYIISAAAFGLAIHTYPTYKLVLPVFLFILIWYQGGYKCIIEKTKKTYLVLALVVLSLAIFGAITQTITGGSENRFWSINIFSINELKESIVQKVNLERNVNELPYLLSSGFHNQPVEYTLIFAESYLKNFSLDFLFFHGDKNPRHNMANMGGFYIVEIILILFGLRFLWKNLDKKKAVFITSWILISPIAATFLLDTHALRNAFMLPPMILLSALGLTYLFSLPKTRNIKIIQIVFVGIFAVQFLFFIERLNFLAPNKYSNFWSYPARSAVDAVLENKNNYKYILISSRIDNIEYAYPVYAKINPEQVIKENLEASFLNEYQFKKFDNVYIGALPVGGVVGFINNLDGSVLYIGTVSEKKEFKGFDKNELKNHGTIYGKDGLPAFIIVKKDANNI